MQKFHIGGMTCAACSARVGKAVSSLEGVESCSVNLLTNSMQTEGTATDEAIISAVQKAGYTASVFGIASDKKDAKSADSDEKPLGKRLVCSLVFLACLMYVSMGYTMWGLYLPEFLSANPMSLGLLQLILSTAVLVVNQHFFVNGIRAVFNKSPNMDTLVALGSGASFIYSIYSLFVMSNYLIAGNTDGAFHCLHELYFESAAMILALITVGKMLEARSKGKTTTALNELIDLAPKKATLVDGDCEISVDASVLKVGDIIAVRPGESFAADGVIIWGEGSVDESALQARAFLLTRLLVIQSTQPPSINLDFLKCKLLTQVRTPCFQGL